MRHPARARAAVRPRPSPAASWLAWLALAAALLAAAAAAQAQVPNAPGSTDGGGSQPMIAQQNGSAASMAPGASPGSMGRGSNGVIAPPSSVDPGMPIARPSPDAYPTPNVRPPAPGGDSKVVPK